MWLILKLALLFVWCLALIYLVFLSVLTFIVFHVFLLIFVFWLVVTCIAWTLTFVPVLAFVVIPWYQRRCRRWTVDEKRSRLSVAYFHPFGENDDDDDDDRERVLWFAVDSLVRRHKSDVQILIYTAATQAKPQEVFRRVNEQWDIDVERWSALVTFVPLRTRVLLDAKCYKLAARWGQAIGSVIVGFEALMRFVPDVFVDLTGHVFTYPCFYHLASVPVVSYVHDPLVTPDEIDVQSPTDNSPLSLLERCVDQLFSFVYRCCGNCSTVVFCNSEWTKERIRSLWKRRGIQLLHPPCHTEHSSEVRRTEKQNVIVSVGRFRPDQNREFQIRAFHQLLQQEPEYKEQWKLVLIGKARTGDEREHLQQLQSLVHDLEIDEQVTFKTNIGSNDIKTQVQQATIGLQTARNQSFDLGVVDMMAAGVIVIAHQSGGMKTDLIEHGQTGFLVSDLDAYATTMEQVLEMTADERCELQNRVRESVSRFDRVHFESLFTEVCEKILSVK